MSGSCEEFAGDPTRFASHPEECANCRKLVEDLENVDRMIAGGTIGPLRKTASGDIDALPIAAWEGANHRPWPVAIAVVAVLGLAAAVLFFLGGVAPLGGMASALSQPFRSIAGFLSVAPVLGELAHRAPGGMRLLLIVAFVAVNIVLLRLLRRAPRGVE